MIEGSVMSSKVHIVLCFVTWNAAVLDCDQIVLLCYALVCVLDCSVRWILALERAYLDLAKLDFHIIYKWVSHREKIKLVEKVGRIEFVNERVRGKRRR